jgi:hypothetical protein
LIALNVRIRKRAGGTNGSRRRSMRIGNATTAIAPTARMINGPGSRHDSCWPRIAPKARPPMATTPTIEPSQSKRVRASVDRSSGT